MSTTNCWARRAAITSALCFQIGLAVAQEIPPAPQRPIPYKTDPVPLEEQGMHIGLVLLLLLGATGLGLYLLRRRMPGLTGIRGQGSRLQIAERVRLNPRCTIYLLQYDQRELLIAQCGEHITRLDAASSLEKGPEDGHD